MSDFYVQFPAGSFKMPAANPAPLDNDTGTNGNIFRHLLDDTTEEFVECLLPEVPADIDTSGTVTFFAKGYASTAVASKNIELKVYHSAKADGESWDAAYANKESGDLATDGTQDELDFFTWTETVTALGWAASDQIRLKLSRIAPSTANLAGDWGLTAFGIIIPIT